VVKVKVTTNFLLGKAIKIYLKDGGAFHFKVTEAGKSYLVGYDEESMELHINISDIDYVSEGLTL
jgi:hypothetical protein